MKKAYMIFDMQYGSTGKGLLAGFLAKREQPDVVVTAWGPNAGHTYIDETGRVFIHRMLANGIVSPALTTVLIGPGSVIDLDILYVEIFHARDIMCGKTIVIHPQAAVVLSDHLETEKRNVKIGSTMKGTGAAVIQRIERNPDDMNTAETTVSARWLQDVRNLGVNVYVDSDDYMHRLQTARVIQIEGAQGFSLSIYHGQYPYCTSRDVTPAQVLADCAIPYSIRPEVYGTLRTFPIRVANRFGDDGTTYSSGPCYPDQVELQWEDLGMKPELTTVTKLPRRIFSFSFHQLQEASFYCAPTAIFLNFINYLSSEEDLSVLVDQIENVSGADVVWFGTGPNHNNVIDAINMTAGMVDELYAGEK